ncbi:unnamed protein product [Protopolystoma xenopodis]|uniref:Uncharacterized protein n=1 Tax=Protopolystoma xenopodis TaxID=117903 RepID=A0A3S5AT14_9PLAT|nr:unnamed protein product [Protopolystoma xenopodis]
MEKTGQFGAFGSVSGHVGTGSCRPALGSGVSGSLATCNMTEARYLLDRLFEMVVERDLTAKRCQSAVAQLRADFAISHSERNQELDMLRLALQHAGVPLDNLESLLCVAEPARESNNSRRHRRMATSAIGEQQDADGFMEHYETADLSDPSNSQSASSEYSDSHSDPETNIDPSKICSNITPTSLQVAPDETTLDLENQTLVESIRGNYFALYTHTQVAEY